MSATSAADRGSLLDCYRGLISDLDGVVYLGHLAVREAVPALIRAAAAGCRIAYATNNAARPPDEVAAQLRSLGLSVGPADVVTSPQAGAGYLADTLGRGAAILAVGGPGVAWALEQRGLTVVRARQPGPRVPVAAVLQGLGKDVNWVDLAEAALAIQSGALWVATNRDATVPTDRGQCPGNGALIAAVQCAVDVTPVVTGKPEAPLYRHCAAVLGLPPEQILAVGDRLDTDVVGAGRAGMHSLHVSTGVDSWEQVALADAPRRPTYLARDLSALHQPYLSPVCDQTTGLIVATCGAARVRIDRSGGLELSGPVQAPVDHRRRAMVAGTWAARDAGWPALEAAAWAQARNWCADSDQPHPDAEPERG